MEVQLDDNDLLRMQGQEEVVESIKVIYPDCPIYPGSCNAKIPYDKTPPASLEYMQANQCCRE